MAFINGKDHYNTLLYDGNGSTNAQTGLGFQPGLIWIKNRDGGGGSHDHYLFDQVRGTTKYIRSNSTAAEGTASGVTAFGTDGFTLGSSDGMNENGRTFLSWNWKANGQGSSNTNGSTNTTYTSVNTAAGFSISQYAGSGSNATVGHGLGKPPKMIIIKSSTNAEQWVLGHSNMDDNPADSWQYYMNLQDNAVRASASDRWQNTLPTNDVFSLGTESQVNGSGKTYIAYCWSEIPGYSAFGMYKGQGNADGPAVKTGFKPAWVLVRNASATNNWFVQDSKRIGRNPNNHLSKPNSAGADDTGNHIDILSNGFKVRSSSANNNGSGNYMIYAAFAQAPATGSNNIPCTAR